MRIERCPFADGQILIVIEAGCDVTACVLLEEFRPAKNLYDANNGGCVFHGDDRAAEDKSGFVLLIRPRLPLSRHTALPSFDHTPRERCRRLTRPRVYSVIRKKNGSIDAG